MNKRLIKCFSILKNFRGDSYGSSSGGLSSDSLTSGLEIDETKESALRKAVMEGKDNLNKIVQSKKRMKLAMADPEFMEWMEEKQTPATNQLFNSVGETINIDKDQEEITDEVAKKMGSISRNSEILGSLSGGMEEPGKGLFEALLNAVKTSMSENAALAAKVKLLKADETGIDSLLNSPEGAAVAESTTDEDFEKATGKSRTDVLDNAKLANIKVTDEGSLFKLGENLAKVVHKDKYDKAVLQDIIDNWEGDPDDWTGQAARLKNIYRSAFHVFSERIKIAKTKLKNYSSK